MLFLISGSYSSRHSSVNTTLLCLVLGYKVIKDSLLQVTVQSERQKQTPEFWENSIDLGTLFLIAKTNTIYGQKRKGNLKRLPDSPARTHLAGLEMAQKQNEQG